MIHYIALAAGVVSNTVGLIFAKRAATALKTLTISWAEIGVVIKTVLTTWELILSITLFGLGFVLYTYSLTRLNLHTAYPMFVSGTMILVMISSAVLLGEAISVYDVIGVALIIGGISLVTLL
jgi:multidrug transporter EmrE-like cation transporter